MCSMGRACPPAIRDKSAQANKQASKAGLSRILKTTLTTFSTFVHTVLQNYKAFDPPLQIQLQQSTIEIHMRAET